MTTIERAVLARVEIAAQHHWPNAPAQVEYLRYPHRHVFKIQIEMPVDDPDREIEFITLGLKVKQWLIERFPNAAPGVLDFGTYSCEALATMLLLRFNASLVIVSEDGENAGLARRPFGGGR